MSTREPYKGSRRKLLLAFDIGTTYSGVSYWCVSGLSALPILNARFQSSRSWLGSGHQVCYKVHPYHSSHQSSWLIIFRFPCQTRSGGDAKIPTVIYYDKNGDVKAIGAETLEFEEGLVEDDEKETFFKAEWYASLFLRASTDPN